ncbi:helix-turn-helix transcriptional regulator [Acidovorax sp.]|uniref:helix-turn-helix transcriptional regulator n=1 Tax=Acidovorax sp. TaxID=1872122 RepID=UPI002FA93818
MKTTKPTAQVATTPTAALCRADAAAYVALSDTTFEKLIREGHAPAPRRISSKRVVWLRRELDEWLESLPVSDLPPPANTGTRNPEKSSAHVYTDADRKGGAA